MKFLLLMMVLSFQTFATEEEGMNSCEAARLRRSQIHREVEDVNRELIRRGGIPEDYVHRSVTGDSWSCEEEPDHIRDLVERRQRLEKKLRDNSREIERSCGRDRPEAI